MGDCRNEVKKEPCRVLCKSGAHTESILCRITLPTMDIDVSYITVLCLRKAYLRLGNVLGKTSFTMLDLRDIPFDHYDITKEFIKQAVDRHEVESKLTGWKEWSPDEDGIAVFAYNESGDEWVELNSLDDLSYVFDLYLLDSDDRKILEGFLGGFNYRNIKSSDDVDSLVRKAKDAFVVEVDNDTTEDAKYAQLGEKLIEMEGTEIPEWIQPYFNYTNYGADRSEEFTEYEGKFYRI